MNEVERKLFNELQIVYGIGKGNHLVSSMIPNDCKKLIYLLIINTYLPIQKKVSNSLWHPTHHNAVDATLINATNQRGRVSTLYAALDITDGEREYFYAHMGHSEAVNFGTYQRPLHVQAITKVGMHLQQIDKG